MRPDIQTVIDNYYANHDCIIADTPEGKHHTENKKIHQSFGLLASCLKDAAMIMLGSPNDELMEEAGVNLSYEEKNSNNQPTNTSEKTINPSNDKLNEEPINDVDKLSFAADFLKDSAKLVLGGYEELDPKLAEEAGVDTSYGN